MQLGLTIDRHPSPLRRLLPAMVVACLGMLLIASGAVAADAAVAVTEAAETTSASTATSSTTETTSATGTTATTTTTEPAPTSTEPAPTTTTPATTTPVVTTPVTTAPVTTTPVVTTPVTTPTTASSGTAVLVVVPTADKPDDITKVAVAATPQAAPAPSADLAPVTVRQAIVTLPVPEVATRTPTPAIVVPDPETVLLPSARDPAMRHVLPPVLPMLEPSPPATMAVRQRALDEPQTSPDAAAVTHSPPAIAGQLNLALSTSPDRGIRALALLMGMMPFAPGNDRGLHGPPSQLALLFFVMLLAAAPLWARTIPIGTRRIPTVYRAVALRPG